MIDCFRYLGSLRNSIACLIVACIMLGAHEGVAQQEIPEQPAGPGAQGVLTGYGIEVAIFIGAGEQRQAGGGPGLPNTHPTLPTGLVEGYISTMNLDSADVALAAAYGELSSNGVGLGIGPKDFEASSAVSSVSVSPTANTTYAYAGQVGSCIFVGLPAPPPPVFGDDDDDDDDDDGSPEYRSPTSTPSVPTPNFTSGDGGSACILYTATLDPVFVTYALPQIASVSPSPLSANIGTSGSFTVQGSNLADESGISTPAWNGQLWGSVPSPGSNTETVNYSIPSTATLGNYQFTISNEWGPSNSVNFTVGAPAAAIAQLTPPVWPAGTAFPLQISGSGFGTLPTVTISALGITPVTTTIQSNGNTITIPSVTISPDAPNEVATVQVQPGYAGSTYVCGNCNGGSPLGSDVAPVSAITAPAPIIILGSDITQCGSAPNQANSTQTPSAGQRVAFVGCIPAINGNPTVVSESWSPATVSSDVAIGNFTVTGSPNYTETISPVSATTCQPGLPCAFNAFYFVTIGTTQTFKFTYTLANGNQGSASITFTTTGPNGATIKVTPGGGVLQYSLAGTGDVVGLGNGNSNSTSGIFFAPTVDASATVPGQYSWVQIVTKDIDGVVDPILGKVVLEQDDDIPGLDGSYPYPSSNAGNLTGDSPYKNLLPQEGEISQTFGATMYLMWTPQADASCQAGTNACVIPVPLAAVPWGFSDDTVNTLNPAMAGTYKNWLLNPCSAMTGGANVTLLSKPSDYPMWTQVAR